MTIDEEIQRIKEKMACDYNISGCDTCNISSCEDKDIVIQLAEWLEELKAYRENVLYRNLHEQDKKVYNNAIDDFVERLNEKCDAMIKEKWNSNVAPISWAEAYSDFKDDIDEIAEQLKAGEDNESI